MIGIFDAEVAFKLSKKKLEMKQAVLEKDAKLQEEEL